ncbi:HET-domain-containing protein [Trichoderma citrinoviride]|uniref:HET-domain-containing protein n=1 Tax=Trichoderma citrinoviride TaxID=58853 RepID=A0A2T4B286_9HYPO|nr:HET-domain-containing protein [Trichoderma citrinoviride]PTB63321.1 HET-domain-containing protein [Trichoderma citrinoviride]
MEEYKYEPLNLDCAAIRLLRLHHGLRGPISCELFQAELHRRENTVAYEALSYAWGSPNRTGSIIVNGCHMTVTFNLHQALLHLRQEDEDRVLWVDAVCIDQANNKEKGHQVAQMGGIYKEADRVIFRLGRGSYETDTFMDSLQLLQQASVKLGCRDWSRQDVRWENIWARSQSKVYYSGLENMQRRGLEEILTRPWFRRVWILQEVAFARAGIVSCGRKAVSASLFSLAPLLLRVTPDAHCQSVIDLMPSQWRETSRWSRSQTLHVLLIEFGGSDATDPRDLVYALRAMSADLRDTTTLMPDYGKCEQDLVRDVYLYIYSYEPEFLEWRKRPRSMRELVASLRELHGKNLVPTLLKIPPMCKDLQKIIKGRAFFVDQGTLRSAAQYDRNGELVELLLRYRGGELTVDSEAIICATKNSSVPAEILEIFFRFNTQPILIVTEKMLLAAAKNSRSSDMAMDFLLSQKTEDYNNIAAIVDAILRNPCNDTEEETIRILLHYNNQGYPANCGSVSERRRHSETVV